MFWRNLLFLGVVAGGGLLFVGSLFPVAAPTHWENADGRAAALKQDASFQQAVAAIDAAFRERWNELQIKPAPRADELAIIRRASLALTGTIPSLEEIRMLQRIPERGATSAVSWWIAGLLEDPRSSDYLAERFARAYVGTMDGPFLIYRRRRFVSWLAERLHEHERYDQIVGKLIASDGLWTSEPATNFITVNIAPDMVEKGPDETKLAARVYRAFLGIRIDCAQCHDHPFHGPEPGKNWSQEDFHNLAAFFGRTEQSFTGVREGKGTYEWDVHKPTPAEVAAFKKRNDQKRKDEKDSDKDDRIDSTSGGAPLIVKREGTPAVPFLSELLPAHGNYRERLAGWVTHPQNKPFARATVNRVWALLFGQPLVDPVDDLPLRPPADPSDANYLGMKVLDLVAEDFVRHDFDLPRLIQLIAATEAFQVDYAEDPRWSDEQLQLALDNWACFRLTRLRPEQVVGAMLQACSVQTIDHESHIIARINRYVSQNQFVERYGDAGEDELLFRSGTIPQRLLLLNGELAYDRTKPEPLVNAATQIANLAPDDAAAIETAYLAVLSREPTVKERQRFLNRLKDARGDDRQRVLEDLYWTLLNDWQFSWNH
jgi:hypothetical protein